jgi:hypothetical protein
MTFSLRTLLAPLALSMALPALSAPVVAYEVVIPVSAIEESLGTGLFDGKGSVAKANEFVLRVEAQLGPIPTVSPLSGLLQSQDGFAAFDFDFPRAATLEVTASLRGASASFLPATEDLGKLSDNLSTDSASVMVVEDIFDGVRPSNSPSFFKVNRFEFELSILGELEQFELTFLEATDEFLSALPEQGGVNFFRLIRKNDVSIFRTSDLDMRLTAFEANDVPGPGGGTVPEPTSLALAVTALALMSRVRRLVAA